MLYTLYRNLTACSAPVLDAMLKKRVARGKEDPARVQERRGQATKPRLQGKLMWFHGASVGESLSILPLLNTLKARLPDWHFLVTTGTVNSAGVMEKRLPPDVIHQYIPLDHPQWVERFFDHWQPDAVIWLESELWPNCLQTMRQREVPAALINARMRPKSQKKWRYARKMIAEMLSGFTFTLVGARNDISVFRDLGARNVHYVGSLKFGASPLPVPEQAYAEFARMTEGRRRIGFMSTHPSEETLAMAVHTALQQEFPDLLTVIAPRKITRGAEIADEARAKGLTVALRSAGEAITPETAIYVADTIGEMGIWYKTCPLAIIGGSFIPFGGQNPLEATHFGSAVLYGPAMFNFVELCAAMEQAGAAEVLPNREALLPRIRALLDNPEELARIQEASLQLAKQNMGVIDAFADEIVIQLVERKP